MAEFGENLKKVREERGITQQTLAITSAYLLGAMALNIVFLIICINFFGSKNNVTPVPLYIAAAVYGVIGIVSFFSGFMVDIPLEIFRDVFMLHTFALMENMLLLVLLTVMAYTLNRKRNLAVK